MAMATKLKDLFCVGEDFDEDLLQTDWDVAADPVLTAAVPLSVKACLRAPATPCAQVAVSHQSPVLPTSKSHFDHLSNRNAAVFALGHSTGPAVSPSPSRLEPTEACPPAVPASNPKPATQNPVAFQDDFDDWDLDLDELDECALQQAPPPDAVQPRAVSPCPAKRLRSPLCAGGSLGPGSCGSSSLQPVCSPHPKPLASHPVTSFCSARASSSLRPPVSVRSRCLGAQSPATPPPLWPGATSRPQWRKGPAGGPQSPAVPSLAVPTHPLRTPVLTNHLVQLVSAANRKPQKSHTPPPSAKMRRFPGPAGLLPQQLHGRSLDDVVVAQAQMPAHGAVARTRAQVPSSQAADEEEFARGPWAAMKAEMGLDERNPACFLHSYSVVMVLRKAALKELARNKVPNMAVMVKTLQHTHADAKAVFQDPTGEMQGTVHRHLLEDRHGELKAGAVLLLKQVGVFSPSHRNHYLNITPSNLLRIYPPRGAAWSSTSLSHHAPEEARPKLWQPSGTPLGTAPRTALVCGDEGRGLGSEPERSCAGPARLSETHDSAWDADDLDELLGELPVESYTV